MGLGIDEALVFWRTAFSTISDDKFKKEYQYNVRHSYGLEGGRRNYKPLRYVTKVRSSCFQLPADFDRTPARPRRRSWLSLPSFFN